MLNSSSIESLRQPLEVKIGSVFKESPERPLGSSFTRAVVGFGLDGTYCFSAPIYRNNNGKEAIAPTGRSSTGREHIWKVVDDWGLDRILEALEVGYFDIPFDIRMKQLWAKRKALLIEESKKSPILLGNSVPLL